MNLLECGQGCWHYPAGTLLCPAPCFQAYEIVDEAFAVIQMRPSKADVERELATWKVGKTDELLSVFAHRYPHRVHCADPVTLCAFPGFFASADPITVCAFPDFLATAHCDVAKISGFSVSVCFLAAIERNEVARDAKRKRFYGLQVNHSTAINDIARHHLFVLRISARSHK